MTNLSSSNLLQAASIEAKIVKICSAFRARCYDLPDMDDAAAVKKLMNDNYTEMHDARVVLLKVGRWEFFFSSVPSFCCPVLPILFHLFPYMALDVPVVEKNEWPVLKGRGVC